MVRLKLRHLVLAAAGCLASAGPAAAQYPYRPPAPRPAPRPAHDLSFQKQNRALFGNPYDGYRLPHESANRRMAESMRNPYIGPDVKKLK